MLWPWTRSPGGHVLVGEVGNSRGEEAVAQHLDGLDRESMVRLPGEQKRMGFTIMNPTPMSSTFWLPIFR